MAVLTDDEAIKYILANQRTHKWITDARTQRNELFALIEGDGFDELLIQIEHLESKEKAKARKKYSRPTTDFFARLLKHTDNVFSATGGSKQYDLDTSKKKELNETLMNIRGGKSLEQWNETFWMPAYHYDPNGITILEYDTERLIKPFPVEQSILTIRNYIPNGMKVEVILFEPVIEKTAQGGSIKKWRLIDDEQDRIFNQSGKTITLDEDNSFTHPFGEVPVLINSDLKKADGIIRVSPIDKILGLIKEYARDQSIKTLFKFLQGMPLFWRYVSTCVKCSGTGEINDKPCGGCGGMGIFKRRDITDSIDLPIPKQDEIQLAPEIAGWITPPLDIWQRYDDELELLEDLANLTHWGRTRRTDRLQTATEILDEAQPVIQRLDKYSNVAESRERILTEWIANFIFESKKKDERIASVSYGRNYSILPAASILDVYQKAKKEGDNATILDRLFNEYLQSKHKSDPLSLSESLVKAEVEPYLHYNLKDIGEIFGNEEAQKKMLFEDWWRGLDLTDKAHSADELKVTFDEWFIEETKIEDLLEPDPQAVIKSQTALRGSVGGVSGIIALLGAISEGKMTEAAAAEVLVAIFGIDKTIANEIVKQPLKEPLKLE